VSAELGAETALLAAASPVRGAKAFVSVWLMLISCSSWFMENIWLTMVVGSIGCVGSCDCSSVTSKLMKVLCAWSAADCDALAEFAGADEPVPLVGAVLALNMCATGVIVDIP
jgi:hypothetical protein